MTVSHQAVALAAASSISPAGASPRDLLSGAQTAFVAIAIFSGPPGVILAGATAIWSRREWIVEGIDDAIDKMTKHILPPVADRLVDAVAQTLGAQGDVVTKMLRARRTADLRNTEAGLTSLQDRLERRQKLTDEQFDKAKANASAALGELAKTLGVQLPTGQVESWFDQAEAGFDDNYDKVEAAVQQAREYIKRQLGSPSAAAKPSAQVAVSAASKTAGTKQSGAAKAPTAARSARQGGNPTAANRSGKAATSPSSHARTRRAAK